MRVFWILVGLTAVLVGAWLALSGEGARRAREQAARELAKADAARAEAAEADALARSDELPAPIARPEPTKPSPVAPTKPEPKKEAQPIKVEPPKPDAVTPDAAKPAPPPAAGARTLAGYAVDEATVETRDDGTTLIDGVHVLKGRGTPESPYEITWDMLTAAEATLDPRAGKKRIPAIAGFLHEKHVRLRGYVSFPLMIKEPRECLAMLNQWDGCCIGVPPTPYDAVEVALKKPAAGPARYATAGSLTGVLQVKPYVMGDWLVGLYVMSQGSLDASDFGGPAGP